MKRGPYNPFHALMSFGLYAIAGGAVLISFAESLGPLFA